MIMFPSTLLCNCGNHTDSINKSLIPLIPLHSCQVPRALDSPTTSGSEDSVAEFQSSIQSHRLTEQDVSLICALPAGHLMLYAKDD